MQAELFATENYSSKPAIETPATETRACLSCKGTGQSDYSSTGKCNLCHGARALPVPDVHRILRAIAGRKGLRSKAPEYWGVNYTTENVRAYYVWRLARFHGGADVTMPITAETLLHGDPWQPELSRLAEMVAKRAYGTDMAAAYRWAGALGHEVHVPDGMPATAFSSGPVVSDGNKPDFEMMELV